MGVPHQGMPARVHECWRRVYDYCAQTFTSIPGYTLHDAELSADAAVAGWYTADGRRRAPRRAWKLPRLGELLVLGEFRGVWSAKPNGEIVHSTDSNVPLLWSQRMKTAVVFPAGLKLGKSETPSPHMDRMMRMWARGRPANAAFDSPRTPQPQMDGGDVAIAVEYVSDKFHHGSKWINYVHHHEPGVVCSVSRTSSAAGPTAVALRGGKLRITRDGLEG